MSSKLLIKLFVLISAILMSQLACADIVIAPNSHNLGVMSDGNISCLPRSTESGWALEWGSCRDFIAYEFNKYQAELNKQKDLLGKQQDIIGQLQQQLQEALSKKIDETVTAKLTDSSSTLVSKAVGNKLAEKSGDTTVLSNAVIDALKVTDDRSALNQDSEGKPLAANKFKIEGLSNYSLDGHHFIMATLSGSYDCSSALTNIIYLPMDGNESSTQAMLLSTAFAFHRTVDVNPDPQSHEVVANVPVESAYAHNCVLNTVNVN